MDSVVGAMDCGTGLTPDVERAARGDREAFARLIAATQSTVTALTLARVGVRAEAEEIAQEVYLSAWRGLGSLKNPSSFLPWIRQLARNQSNEALRRRTRARRVFREGDVQALLERAVDPAGSPARAIVDQQLADAVAAAIDALPDDAREVVILYYREGRSVEQVAALLELSPEAVRKRMSRARDVLRGNLVDRFGDALESATPGTEFSGSVLAVLPAAGASTKVGTTIGGATLLGKGGAILAAVGLGTIVGGVPLWLGVSRAIATSSDERERSALRIFRWLRLAKLAAFLFLWNTAAILHPPALLFWAIYGFSVVGTVFSHFIVLPRVFRQRWEKLDATDPRAGRRRRSMRRFASVLIIAAYALGAWVIWHAMPVLTGRS